MGYSHHKGLSWLHVLFALVLIVILAGLCTPLILRRSVAGPRTETLNNAKSIAGGLIAFQTEYGTYPCSETRELLRKKGLTKLTHRDDANAYLAQLIVTDIIDSEARFYAHKMQHMFKGDNNISNAKEILSKGENGFAYIMAQNNKPLTDVKSITPLIIAPILTAGENPTFDPLPYQDYYVYGAVDGSGKVGKIDENGRTLSKGRTHLFQTGTDSLFGTETPVVKLPLGLKSPTSPTPFPKWYYFIILFLLILLWGLRAFSKSKRAKTPPPISTTPS